MFSLYMVNLQILIHKILFQSLYYEKRFTEYISAELENVGSRNNYGAAYFGVPTFVRSFCPS